MTTPNADKWEWYYPNTDGTADGMALHSYTVDGTCASNTLVSSELAQADDYWNGAIGKVTSGSNDGQYFHIRDFDAATDAATLAKHLPQACGSADTFELYAGGAWRSSNDIPGMTSGATDLGGITIVKAGYYNGDGNGTVNFYYNGGSTEAVAWTPPGGALGAQVDVSAGGTFTAYGTDEDKWISFTAVPGSFGVADDADVLALTYPKNIFIPDVEGYESATDKLRFRTLPGHNNDTDAMVDARFYLDAHGTATATNITTALGTAADTLSGSDFSTWPSSGWIKNTTANSGTGDLRCFYGKSGNDITCMGVDWGRFPFDAGTNEPAVDSVITGGTSSASGTVAGVAVSSGSFSTTNAAGYVYVYGIDGQFTDDEEFTVDGTDQAFVNGSSVLGYRDYAATSWGTDDAVSYYPDSDIALDVGTGEEFTGGTCESSPPINKTFTAPETYTLGIQAGDIGAGTAAAVHVREFVVDGMRPRSDVRDSIIVEWS